ncbi:MFS transporter [Burkholderia glumae]|uniref:MFS transporter n=1 Tax=Burkholderia glumae TaxID=337 RepID=UPI0020B1D3C7|nr:MFS transporter [Burkholderia glumae]
MPVSRPAREPARLDAAFAKPPAAAGPLVVALALGFFLYLAFGVSRVGATILIVRENRPSIQLGIVMAMYSLAPLLIAVHAGAVATRLGPRSMLAGGGAVLLGGALLQAVPGPAVLLFPGALLCGVGFTLMQIALQLHIGECGAPGERVRRFGFFSLTQSAATSLAALLGGYLSGQWGVHAPLRLAALMGAVLLALLAARRRVFRSSRPARPAAEGAAAAEQAGRPRTRDRATLSLLRQRDVRKVLVAGALLAMAWDLHTFLVPFISRSVGLSAKQIGIVLGLFSGATFVIRVCLPGLVRLLSSIWIIRGALIVVGLGFAVYPWHTSYETMCVLAICLGLALGTAQPNLLALVHDVAAERDVGRLIGVRTILLNVGASLWPLCFGALGLPVVRFVLPAAGLVFVLAGLGFSLGRDAQRRDADAPAPPGAA